MWTSPFRERVPVRKEFVLPSRTKQSFKEESDINAIMRRYLSGQTDVVMRRRTEPRYGDFTSASDFFTAMTKVKEAEMLFMELPAEVRAHVDNDPGKLLELVFDPERREECAALGLLSEAGLASLATELAGASGGAGAGSAGQPAVPTTGTNVPNPGPGEAGGGPPTA